MAFVSREYPWKQKRFIAGEGNARHGLSRRLWLVVCVLLLPLLTGCFRTSSETIYVPTAPEYGQNIDAIASEFFASDVAQRMRSDAAALLPAYGGLNVFTTAQYSRGFFTGTIDLGDIFDARIPANLAVFRAYASAAGLIDTAPATLNYNRYSTAANRFLAEYGFDAVLFHPDEIHPLFTKTSDTWLFLREPPDGTHYTAIGARKLYYSARITKRRLEITGGLKLQAVNGNGSGMVYLPIPGEVYVPYAATQTTEIATSTAGAVLNLCVKMVGSADQMSLRQKAGIVASSLSGRQGIRVGSWKDERYTDSYLNIGFSFFDSPDQYTWGQNGHYLLILDPAFW